MLGILLETTVSKISTISALMGPLVNINFLIFFFNTKAILYWGITH